MEWKESACDYSPLYPSSGGIVSSAVRLPGCLGDFHVSGTRSGARSGSRPNTFTLHQRKKIIKLIKRLRYADITSTVPQACPRSSGTAPNDSTSASRHKQNFNQEEQRTFSRAVVKSALFTLIRRSRNAIKPASVQIALISAPDKSSFAMTYSSRSTSVAKLIREVCNLKKKSVQRLRWSQ
jgi:hypothetical protein